METLDDVLEHHGIKGMKWGVRRDRPTTVTVTQVPGKQLKATGGHRLKAHEDAVRAEMAKQRAKKSTVKSLSNAELKQLVERMNLEAQYSRLSSPSKGVGQKFLEEQLQNYGRQKLKTLAANK